MADTKDSLQSSTSSKGLAITSMVLGIVSVVLFVIWFMSVPAAIVGLVLGIISLAKKYSGKGMAITGVVTSGAGIVLVVLVFLMVLVALPSLQTSQRDTVRKSDLSIIQSSISDYTANNRGKMPSASDIDTSDLSYIKSITDAGNPTTSTAKYQVGVSCDGQTTSARAASLTVLLESGSKYCLDY